ncbi:MAG TPA: HAD-IA family hydrolase [Acidimicrobiales bacterium]|nr:HAD-IA family hydrolase [Acidimicrobiales bacterium]
MTETKPPVLPKQEPRRVTVPAEVLLIDMDGTLVDSTGAVERAWNAFADRHDLDVKDVLAMAHGRPTAETVRMLARPGTNVVDETRRIELAQIDDREDVVAVPGAAQLLSEIPQARWALVTSAGRQLAQQRMAAAGLPMPAVVVTADDVTMGKPAPEGYLAAAARLRQLPSTAIVIEDTGPGVDAGLAAGCAVIAVGDVALAAQRGLYRLAELRLLTIERRPDDGLTLHWEEHRCSGVHTTGVARNAGNRRV